MMAGGYPADPWAMLDAGERLEESPAVRRRRREHENHSLNEFGRIETAEGRKNSRRKTLRV